MKNKYVFKQIVHTAERRLKEATDAEENYKRKLFEQAFIKANEANS